MADPQLHGSTRWALLPNEILYIIAKKLCEPSDFCGVGIDAASRSGSGQRADAAASGGPEASVRRPSWAPSRSRCSSRDYGYARLACKCCAATGREAVVRVRAPLEQLPAAMAAFRKADSADVVVPQPQAGGPGPDEWFDGLLDLLAGKQVKGRMRAAAARLRSARLVGARPQATLAFVTAAAPFGGWGALRDLEISASVPLSAADMALLRAGLPGLETLAIERSPWAPATAPALFGHQGGQPPFLALRSLELRGAGTVARLPLAGLCPGLERLALEGLEGHGPDCRITIDAPPALKDLAVLNVRVFNLDAAAPGLTALTSLELLNAAGLRQLHLGPDAPPPPPGGWPGPGGACLSAGDPANLAGLRQLPGLRKLVVIGYRRYERLPAAVAALTALTRLDITLRPPAPPVVVAGAPREKWPGVPKEPPPKRAAGSAGEDADPLWSAGDGRKRACPLARCTALRELVLRDAGPWPLRMPGAALAGMPELELLDLGGVARPQLGDWLPRLRALRRIIVPHGAADPQLLRRAAGGSESGPPRVAVVEVAGVVPRQAAARKPPVRWSSKKR